VSKRELARVLPLLKDGLGISLRQCSLISPPNTSQSSMSSQERGAGDAGDIENAGDMGNIWDARNMGIAGDMGDVRDMGNTGDMGDTILLDATLSPHPSKSTPPVQTQGKRKRDSQV
jgi:hypothetical protein